MFKNRKHSDETKKKMSEAAIERFKNKENHPMCGKHHTAESLKKMSEAQKGVNHHMYGKRGTETSMYGKKHTEESKKIMSEAHKGKIPWNKDLKGCYSDETRKKMSEASSGENNPMYGVHRYGEENPMYGVHRYGEENPNWKGGIAAEPYCEVWIDREYKESIKEYYNHQCMNPLCLCNSENLVLHHVDYVKKNCHWKNIIPVCNSSNGRANKDRWAWTEIYQRVIENNIGEVKN